MYSEFTMFHRHSKKHGKIFYVRFRDPETGERMTAVSSGKTTKKEATNWAIEQIKIGTIDNKSKINFTVYTKNWFIWDKCPYIKLQLSKGNRFSHSYADDRRGYLLNHLLPYFGKMKLSSINVPIVENFLSHMQECSYSSSAINNAFYTLSIIMKEAMRQGTLKENPLDKIDCVVKKTSTKDIIPLEIAKSLLNPDNINIYWGDNRFHYLFNLIAFTTGLRQAEILALRRIDIEHEYINACHTWDRKYGLKRPKYESERYVPIPDFTYSKIQIHLEGMNCKDPEALLFNGNKDFFSAIDHKAINKAFKKALNETELDLESLNITFHSWRHTFNTIMRGKIPDEKLRKITGHKSEKMTDHYTHETKAYFDDVRMVQNKLLMAS